MQSTPKAVAVGAFAYFFPENAPFVVPNPGGVSNRLAKPGAEDEDWLKYLLGNIETFKFSKESKTQEIRGPLPGSGIIVTKDVVTTGFVSGIEFTTNETSRLALQCFKNTQQIESDTAQINPDSTAGPKGWLKFQLYDHDSQQWIIEDRWAFLDCTDGFEGGDEKIVKPRFVAKFIYAPEQTMTV